MAADQSWAASIVVSAADMGGSWTATQSEGPSGVTSTALCAGFSPDRSDLTYTGNVLSDDFARADGAGASTMATIWQSDAQARADWDRSLQPAFFKCIVSTLVVHTRTFSIAVSAKGALALPALAARTAAYRINFTVTTRTKLKHKLKKHSSKGAFDLVFVGQRRATASLAFVSFARSPITTAYETALARLVAGRMAGDPRAPPTPSLTP